MAGKKTDPARARRRDGDAPPEDEIFHVVMLKRRTTDIVGVRSDRMRARGARLGLDMAGLASTRLVFAIECGPFAAHAGSTPAGARAHAGHGPLRDRRSRFRGFRDDHRRRACSPDGRAFGTLGAPGPGEGSAHQIAALVVWLKRHGVDFGDRARFARIRGMGVGGVATRDLRQGDAIFSLPLFAPVETESVEPKASDVLSCVPLASVPLVITTSVVMDQKGPLGRLARALAAAGLVAASRGGGESLAPTHRLGGVRESDHEFPLHVSATTLLALALLFTSAKATRSTKKTPFLSRRGATLEDARRKRPGKGGGVIDDGHEGETLSRKSVSASRPNASEPSKNVDSPHWSAYVDLLPRETDALLEWSDEDLAHLKGSRHVRRALERRALVDGIHDAIFPALLAVDPRVLASRDEEDAASAENENENENDENDDVIVDLCETSAFASKRAFRWAFATTLARAFELPSEVRRVGAFRGSDVDVGADAIARSREKEFGLCPGLDLFNHGDDAEACVVEGLDEVGETTAPPAPSGAFDFPNVDPDDVRYDEDEARLRTLGPRVTLRAGVGGASGGEQLFHKYADEADGGSVLEFGFARLGGGGARAADCDFSCLLKRHAPEKRAGRLAYLAELGLCRSFSYEITDAPPAELSSFEETRRATTNRVARVPEDAARVARVLTLDDSEFDAVRAWDDEDAGAYDGTRAFGAAHRKRYAAAMAALFEDERNALFVPAIPIPRRGENTRPIADDDASRERRARREAMARCVHEGEVSLLEELARDFRRLANEARRDDG